MEAMGRVGIITVRLSDVQSLPDKERRVLRNYVMGGSKTEARYRDEPEVRKILSAITEAPQSQTAPSDDRLLLDRDKTLTQGSEDREDLARTLHRVAYPDANFCLDRPECRARLREADAIIADGWRKGMVGTPDIPDWSILAKRYSKALANVYEDRVEYQAALWALTSACLAVAIKAYEAARLPDPNR
jgi:hypothetical protein